MFSGSVSALCPLLCLKKSISDLRREALVEAFAFLLSSTCSGGTLSLASCADCLLRFIRGRPKGKTLRPASSSSVVLKRPKCILQGVQAEPRRHHKKKRRRWTGRKVTDWKRLQTEKSKTTPLTGSKREDWAMTKRQPHQPGTCMHQMTRTVNTCFSQVKEHGRPARAGCGQVRQAGEQQMEQTAGSRGRQVAIRPAWEHGVRPRLQTKLVHMPLDAFS